MIKEKNKKINSIIQRVAVEVKSENPNLTTIQIAERVHEIVNTYSFYSFSTVYNYCKPGNIEYYNNVTREQREYAELKKHIRESNYDDLFAHLLTKCEILEKRIKKLEVSFYEKEDTSF